MIQQTENVQDKKDDVVSEEVKREEKNSDEETAIILNRMLERALGDSTQKDKMIYSAVFFFVLGLILSFAPTYMQTGIAWIVNTSAILCFACWGGSLFYIHKAYPTIHKNIDVILAFCFSSAAGFYYYAQAPAKMFPIDRVNMRGYSFCMFFLSFSFFMLRIPDYIAFYSKHKGKIKAFFTAKHTTGLVLGILAGGTALFQFIQVVLQVFHR